MGKPTTRRGEGRARVADGVGTKQITTLPWNGKRQMTTGNQLSAAAGSTQELVNVCTVRYLLCQHVLAADVRRHVQARTCGVCGRTPDGFTSLIEGEGLVPWGRDAEGVGGQIAWAPRCLTPPGVTREAASVAVRRFAHRPNRHKRKRARVGVQNSTQRTTRASTAISVRMSLPSKHERDAAEEQCAPRRSRKTRGAPTVR